MKLNELADNIHIAARNLSLEAHRKLRGTFVEIRSDYNGQPYGRSRPSLRGKQCKIRSAFTDEDGLHIFIEGHRLSLHRDAVRFLETEVNKP